jgi:hypothetical protein
LTLPLPRFVVAKPLKNGRTGFYWYVTGYYRKLGCTIPNEPLGANYSVACGSDGKGGRAAILNALFDEWAARRRGDPVEGICRHGTVDWLLREFKASIRFREKVSARSVPDYERSMLMVADMLTKRGDRIGARPVKSITPAAADKIYEKLCHGPRGERLRQAEKVVAICRGGVARGASALSRCLQSRRAEPVEGRNQEAPYQGDQTGRHPRASLSVRLGRGRSGRPGNRGSGCGVLRISSTP